MATNVKYVTWNGPLWQYFEPYSDESSLLVVLFWLGRVFDFGGCGWMWAWVGRSGGGGGAAVAGCARTGETSSG